MSGNCNRDQQDYPEGRVLEVEIIETGSETNVTWYLLEVGDSTVSICCRKERVMSTQAVCDCLSSDSEKDNAFG